MKTNKTTKELAIEIGGHSNLMQAQQEAKEFSLPSVFTRRSGVFPDPVDFGLAIETASAVAKAWPDAPSPLNQFYIDLRLKVTGEEAKIADWHRKVLAAVRIFHASASRKPGEMGERAEHLRFRAEQAKARAEQRTRKRRK